ncbi:leucine-rich repeat receptor-like serine/threonine/tyrosine-protein kinase SOBIR1 [Solanum dulcamara]|uniref:leucine-rich repeat receptor-like serine/threonine/tyrosine-protein kinase SOBIR1 n=1 Tax=Solanum dulcamara TaxID=45834 RepID=UPI002486C1B2|nr:leucine-rich repeat receptor-like serine/threonine/tyrosine-protein kinase SOBIR1 [Solanum dulcamara]
MASTASNFHFFLLSLVTLFLIVQARLNLHPPDHAALLLIQKDLGIQGQHIALHNPCTLPGISCERRPANRTQILRVTRIVFRSNGLRGTLSSAIGKLSELKELSLSDNQLSDQIPVQILDCRKLEILELQNNRFSGKIPSELSSLIRLRVVDFSSNEFSGNLNFLKYFPNLEKLSLADNMFTGKIRFSLKSFRNLRFLNISGNSFLEGPVPVVSQIEHLSADLNRNNVVPKRYILAENSTRSNRISAMGPASNSAIAPAPAPVNHIVPAVHKRNKKKRKIRSWFLGFLAGTFAGGISAVLCSLLFKLVMFFVRRGKNNSSLTIFSPLIKKAEDLAFLENEDGVASLEMIGKGGCGEVYRAELPGSDGKIIAIKKIIQSPMDAAEITEENTKALNKKMRQVKSEIQIVGQIRHRNLLPLLAHMPRPDCHYLVYEYMKNGSLHDILQQVAEGTRELDWLGRHRIAEGVAAGLEYLHINHTQRIIHRDLKPANILLDDDMEARIADFGLAKAVPDAHTHVTTSNVAGTVGFIAPEYHQTLKFTDKCDIYSFGVVLAVLVIGKLPSDDFFQHTSEMSLVKWLRNVMTSDDPKRAIDPKLIGNGYEEQMLLVLKIACFCTLDNPKERPNSKDVRCMLTQIKH